MGLSTFSSVKSFVEFLWNWKNGDGKLVDQNTANIRAGICSGCHNNQSSGDIRKTCSSCNKMGSMVVDKVRANIIQNNTTSYDSQLLACGICGCDLKISVWIPNQLLLKLEHATAYPDFCWKKKILQNLEV